MSVAIIQVPNKARMANGISKCLTAGIEYEMLEDMKVEITCADDVKLVKVIVAFGGKILSASNHKQINHTSPPKHEVQYARTNRTIQTTRRSK
jgi:hypothetical protein